MDFNNSSYKECSSKNLDDDVKLPSCTVRTMASKAITIDNINPNILKLEYAVRGPLVIRAAEIEKELEKGAQKPFKRVIKANIGDAHAMGQTPITFIRQVISCVTSPELIEKGDYPEDVKQRAREILGACGGNSVGSYTSSHGIEYIRRHVAEYIERRDGYPANWEDICLSSGASTAIKNCLQLLCNNIGGKPSGVMIPIPQYPLYSASLAEYGLEQVGYYLDEDHQWGLDIEELERALADASKNCNVRALVVINPGNPTGQVLTRDNIESIIKFAHKHKLFLFADEVYQDNVYAEGSKFFSFKKVLREIGSPFDDIELASFMTVSKGYMGECGLRGGWMELVNLDPHVQAHLYKCISAMLCPSTLGQTAVDCVARPPLPGEPSYELWIREKTAVLDSLNKRAKMIVDTFNQMEGFKCNIVQGAMYAFPRFELPPKAIKAAAAEGKTPDTFYAFRLLEETGICVVPGSGFGQRPGTYHFRTTILPQPELLKEMLDIFQAFHKKFTAEANIFGMCVLSHDVIECEPNITLPDQGYEIKTWAWCGKGALISCFARTALEHTVIMKLEKSLTVDTINQNLLNIEYAVRGPIVQRAIQIERELEKGVPKPFDRVIRANIGDCHALGQKPITFIRQVLALASCPQLMSSPHVPQDVKERVQEILDDCTKGSVGSYSPSNGLRIVRSRVAQYISARDGIPAFPEDIWLGSGASDVIKAVLTMFIENVDGKPPAIMIPIPQYPLFSGTLSELGLRRANYYLDEENGWALQVDELERSWREASVESRVRAIVVINPGNPTGQVLTRSNIEEIVKFAYEHNLFIMADEVYQENIVCKPFYSFKKVMHEMGPPYSNMELASFVTCSKGWAAECGLRSGYVELVNLQPEVQRAYNTARAVMQCPTVLGQCILDCVMKPPSPGEPSYELFKKELSDVHQTLTERTNTAYETFNSIPGYFCNPIDGSMFAYPRISMPESAQLAAREVNMSPDEFYCLRLLEETGKPYFLLTYL
ncbi:hypothetical protein O3G_MSEX008826 [Manduca sexta]|uniref:alanine transaminase n=1 Tax=Manduca sexta TaxID=7130 RepID=A0A922CQN0_MANSE|nr:hypothetical protein O3G_MSEX008826 [Manduca sexta]